MSREPIHGNSKNNTQKVLSASIQSPLATGTALPKRSAKVTSIPSPSASPTPSKADNTVTYSDSGFSPKVITITKGESVTFKNDSETDMWVASNYFPTSTLYPGTSDAQCKSDPVPTGMFEECTGVGNGANWTFEFNSVGRWPYHNHLKPDDGGTVIVTSE